MTTTKVPAKYRPLKFTENRTVTDHAIGGETIAARGYRSVGSVYGDGLTHFPSTGREHCSRCAQPITGTVVALDGITKQAHVGCCTSLELGEMIGNPASAIPDAERRKLAGIKSTPGTNGKLSKTWVRAVADAADAPSFKFTLGLEAAERVADELLSRYPDGSDDPDAPTGITVLCNDGKVLELERA